MHDRATFVGLPALFAATLIAAGCSDPVNPEYRGAEAVAVSQVAIEESRIAGAGTLGSGTTTPGSDLLEFDFDVASDLTGRLFARDWAVVREDGTPGSMTVSETDAGTGLTAVRDGSTACEDPTRGAEFDGIGRLDTGELFTFTVQACDNGAAESGADFFRIVLPDRPYEQGGFLSSGDIVKSTADPPPTGGPVATRLVFTVQPSNTLPLFPITPPVEVAAVDEQGNRDTSFAGPVTIAIGRNGGLLLRGTLSGTRTVAAVDGVATFSDLSIDRLGFGYTLTATASGLTGAESRRFNIGL